MSVMIDNLRKYSKSLEAGAGKNILENKQTYERALPKRAVSFTAAVLLMAGGVLLLGAGSWVLWSSVKADIRSQQTTLNSKISALDEKLNAADKKIERLIFQDEGNARSLEAGMLAIADTQKQLGELSSAVTENKKAQDASTQEINNKLEKIITPPEKNAGVPA